MLRCLVVDDEVFCREFVATLMKPVADCHQASSGGEALEKFRSAREQDYPYDVIIMDIMMPGLSGQATVEAIRSLEKDQCAEKPVDIVMLTGLTSCNQVMESFCQAQSVSYLVKPVSKDALFNVMTDLGHIRR